MNQPKFSAKFKDGLIEAVQTGMDAKPVIAKGLSVQVTREPNGKLRLRAFLVDEEYDELMEVSRVFLREGDTVTLMGLDQPFLVRLG